MPILGAKSRAKRGCASKLACGRRIGPAECTGFMEIHGEFVTSQRVDVGIAPYKQLDRHAASSPKGFCFSPLPAATSQALRAGSP